FFMSSHVYSYRAVEFSWGCKLNSKRDRLRFPPIFPRAPGSPAKPKIRLYTRTNRSTTTIQKETISSVSDWLPASDSRSANHSLDSRVASRQSTMSDVVADSGGAGRYVVTRRTAVSNDVAMPTEGSASTPTSSIHDPAHD